MISHLFGRNKACTVQIPGHIWVSYCRKHYQRTRYHKKNEWVAIQMGLVKLQITRLRDWSDENQKQNSGPYISKWTLSLRKRYKEGLKKRLSNKGSSENTFGAAWLDWLKNKVGRVYTTDEIMDIAHGLYNEAREGNLREMLEVEFLPYIVNTDDSQAQCNIQNRSRHHKPLHWTQYVC